MSVVLSAQPRSLAAREALTSHIVECRGFRTHGALRGERVSGGGVACGRLSLEWARRLRADDPVYVVFSYGTPIAWWSSAGWVVPAELYSVTTLRHQNVVRGALEQVGFVESVEG